MVTKGLILARGLKHSPFRRWLPCRDYCPEARNPRKGIHTSSRTQGGVALSVGNDVIAVRGLHSTDYCAGVQTGTVWCFSVVFSGREQGPQFTPLPASLRLSSSTRCGYSWRPGALRLQDGVRFRRHVALWIRGAAQSEPEQLLFWASKNIG